MQDVHHASSYRAYVYNWSCHRPMAFFSRLSRTAILTTRSHERENSGSRRYSNLLGLRFVFLFHALHADACLIFVFRDWQSQLGPSVRSRATISFIISALLYCPSARSSLFERIGTFRRVLPGRRMYAQSYPRPALLWSIVQTMDVKDSG
ncbi:hypothetical protein BDZ97DRAFT_160440 [Flammula alnicola]|nr:hypothetical protein BDZ97DRAFT_160440 [Flammula alnicola]